MYTTLAGVLALGLVCVSPRAQAQAVCGDRGDVATKLQQGYAEKPISMGLANNGSVIEVFASNSGTFTIVVTTPTGQSCLVAAGENWEDLPEVVAGPGV
jgi:hypothetical protein